MATGTRARARPAPQVVRITPTAEYPMPYALDPASEPEHFADQLASVANTAEALEALGATIEVDADLFREEKQVLRDAIAKKSTKELSKHPVAALGAASFLRAYGTSLALDVVQVRTALTNKLLAIANCGDARHELRAIELLGKHSDIGLFTERSEITINYKTSEGLEAAIKERVKRLLNASVADVRMPSLDEEEGETPYAEFDDVSDPPEDPEEEEAPDPAEPDWLPPLPHDDWEDDDDAGSWG